MDRIIKTLEGIYNGAIKNPIGTGVAGLVTLLAYVLFMVAKRKHRTSEAEHNKNNQKNESSIEVENSNAAGEASIREQLSKRDDQTVEL